MAEFLNNNIKHLRTEKNISQQNLADEIGVDRSTVSRIENGDVETTIDNAIKIADALNVSLDDLVSKDLRHDTSSYNELDVLFSKHKDKLTEGDEAIIKAIIEQRMKEIDKELDGK